MLTNIHTPATESWWIAVRENRCGTRVMGRLELCWRMDDEVPCTKDCEHANNQNRHDRRHCHRCSYPQQRQDWNQPEAGQCQAEPHWRVNLDEAFLICTCPPALKESDQKR